MGTDRGIAMFFEVFVGSVCFFYVAELYLKSRKGAAFARGFPSKLKGLGLEEDYEKTVEYNQAKNNYGYITESVGVVQTVLMACVSPALWSLAEQWSSQLGWAESLYTTTSLFLVFGAVIDEAFSRPFDVYSTFVIEQKFGFNKYTVADYVKDKVKSFFVMTLAINVLLMLGLVAVLEVAGSHAWFYLWMFMTVFVFAFNMAYPVLIAPLFNKFGPIKNPDVQQAIDGPIEQTGLSCKKVFEVDGSKQSSHSNAYVAGFFGSKRIVIYDTLIKDLGGDTGLVNAVVGHEIGHSILQHTWILLGATMANLFVLMWSFGFFQESDAVVLSFGYKSVNTFLRLQCFMQVYMSVIMPFWSILMNGVTRKLEFQADRYSTELGLDISSALVQISKTNKGDLNPDWLHSLVHHNHPPLLERMDAVAAAGKKDE